MIFPVVISGCESWTIIQLRAEELMSSNCGVGEDSFERPLDCKVEKGTPTHSTILAWRIPWMEKPGGLQSMGSHRVGHD